MTSRGPYNKLTFADKKEIVDDANNMTKTALAEKYGLPKTTINSILEKATVVKSQALKKGSSSRCRVRSAKYPELEKRMMAELKLAREKGKLNISGAFMIERAREIAKQLNITNFHFSSRWFDKFKSRNKLTSVISCGESSKVNQCDVDAWMEANRSIIQNYRADDIYNMDETGLFYRMQPNRTLAIQGEACHGGKISKDRVTIMVCVNQTGSDKCPLLVIGKYAKPRCFAKNFNRNQKEFLYRNNKKAWMNSDIFQEWIQEFEQRMAKQNRNVLMLMDNFAGHMVEDLQLEHVRVMFLPPNTTSISQPLDMGVISNFKHFYKRSLVNHYFAQIQAGHEINEIDVLQAIRFAVQAWEQVQPTTIANCFRKALPVLFGPSVPENLPANNGISDEVAKQFFGQSQSFEDFVNADKQVQTHDPLELVLATTSQADSEEDTIIEGDFGDETMDNESDTDSEEEEVTQEEPVKPRDAFSALSTLLAFSSQKGHEAANAFLSKYLSQVIEETNFSKKQSSILNYFSKST